MAASFFLILSFLIINCYAQEMTPNDPNCEFMAVANNTSRVILFLASYVCVIVSIQPPSETLVFTYGSTAEFQCQLQSIVSMTVERVDWEVTGLMRYRGVNTVPDRFGEGYDHNSLSNEA